MLYVCPKAVSTNTQAAIRYGNVAFIANPLRNFSVPVHLPRAMAHA
jgi:hypothetical protein